VQQVMLEAVAHPDVTPPTVAITEPTSSSTLSVQQPIVQLSVTAPDNVGVIGLSTVLNGVTPVVCNGLSSWSTGTITLSAGTNTIVVTATDAASNEASAVLDITY